MNRYWRLDRRLQMLWHRLGGTEAKQGGWRWPRRPKGMHRATQRQLKSDYQAVNEAAWSAGIGALDRFVQTMTRRRTG